MDELKLVLFADTHIGPNAECRPGEEVECLMKQFVDIINTEIKPDLVIELGDRINNNNHDADMANLIKFAAVLENLKMPCMHVFGNHDIHNLSKEENVEILKSPVSYRNYSYKGFDLIFLDTADPVIDFIGGDVSHKQLAWLEDRLHANDLPKIILAHHPMMGQDLQGNPHFASFPHLAALKDGNKIKKTFDGCKNIIVYISAHVHWFYFSTRSGFPFISIPSFTEAYPLKKDAPGMFVELIISDNKTIMSRVRSIAPRRVLGCYSLRDEGSLYHGNLRY
jgi:hypothetical protein